MGRTQSGNNNAYCQDNETSWVHWDLTQVQKDLHEFTRFVIELRKRQPVLRRRKFLRGRSIRGVDVKDIAWFEPNGREMSDSAWNRDFVHCLGVYLSGSEIGEMDSDGQTLEGDSLFLNVQFSSRTCGFHASKTQKQGKMGKMTGHR